MKKFLKIYDRFASWICSFEADKYIHFIIGFLIAFVSFLLFYRMISEKISLITLIVLVIGFVAGLGKEQVDKMRGEKFDIKDTYSTWAGVILGLILGLSAYICLVWRISA